MGGAPSIVTIRPGVQFTQPAADSFRRLEHRLGRPIDVNSTYRDWDTQLKMYNAWAAYVAGRGPKPNHSRAVHPSQSRHCWGTALDSDDWASPGFIALAAEYGWIRTAAGDPTERHHFEYQWQNDKHRNEPVPASGGAATPTSEEDEIMVEIIINGKSYLVAKRFIKHVNSPEMRDDFRTITGVRIFPLTDGRRVSAFSNTLLEFGIPASVKNKKGEDRRVVNDQGLVYDPLTDSYAHGNVWAGDIQIESLLGRS